MDSIRNLPEEQPVLRNYSEELAKIIRSGISPRALKDRLSDYHQRDIAEVLEELTPAERKKLYGILDSDELSGVFEFVDHPYVYIDELNIRKKVDILSCMDPDKAIACLREMPREQREMLIDLISYGGRIRRGRGGQHNDHQLYRHTARQHHKGRHGGPYQPGG